MLYVYGSLMPLRVLEEVHFWKMQEKEHTLVIRELVKTLEAEYVRQLEQWEQVFGRMENAAVQWIEAVIRSGGQPNPYIAAQIQALVRESVVQSEEWIQLLQTMAQASAAVRANPAAPVVLQHIIRESEYFLGILRVVASPPFPGPGAYRAGTYPAWPLPPYAPFGGSAGGAGGPRAAAMAGPWPAAPVAGWPPYAYGPWAAAMTARGGDGEAPGHAAVRGGGEAPEQAARGRAGGPGTDAGAEEPRARISAAGAAKPAPPGDGRGTLPEGLWSDPLDQRVPVPAGEHRLPPLPYAYDALEPHIDAETMRLHHDVHHKSYVDGLNKAETELAQARTSGDYTLVKHWERELAFHGAGHYLHTIFWQVMSPRGGGNPPGAVLDEIRRSFGSFGNFQSQFSAAAEKIEGGGWAILVWSPRSHRLEILTAEKHQNLSQWDVIPLLVLDVWEHAYYLKYRTNRAQYVKSWWNVVDWTHVQDRMIEARKVRWTPY